MLGSRIIGIVAVVTAAVGGVIGPAPAEAATRPSQAKSCADFPAFWRSGTDADEAVRRRDALGPAGPGLRPEPQVALRVLLRRSGPGGVLAEVPLDADRQHPRGHPDQDDLLPHRGRAPRWSCRWTRGRPRQPVRRDHRGQAAGHPHPADEDRQGREHRHAAELADVHDGGGVVGVVPPGPAVRRRLRERPGLPLRHHVQGRRDQEDPGGVSDTHAGAGAGGHRRPVRVQPFLGRTRYSYLTVVDRTTWSQRHSAMPNMSQGITWAPSSAQSDVQPVRAVRIRVDGVRSRR